MGVRRARLAAITVVGMALLKTGDELLIRWPSYPLYPLLAAHAGATPVPVEPDPATHNLDPAKIEGSRVHRMPADAPDPEVVWCALDPAPLPLNYRHEEESGLYYAGAYHLRDRTPGADVDICFGGSISVTAVRLL